MNGKSEMMGRKTRKKSNYGIIYLFLPIVFLFGATNGEYDVNKLISCCQMCKSIFGEPLHRISNCSNDNVDGEYVQCSKLDMSTGLHMTRLACDDWTLALYAQCSNAKAPKIHCRRSVSPIDKMVILNCTWLHFPKSIDQDCIIDLDWPMLFSDDLQSGYVPVQESMCDNNHCTVSFAYPQENDLPLHCPGDKVSFTGRFGKTGIRANLLYELNRLEGTYLPENALSLSNWMLGDKYLTFWFSISSKYLNENSCVLYHVKQFYCRLDAFDEWNGTMAILYSPMHFSNELVGGDGGQHSGTYCQFDMYLQVRGRNINISQGQVNSASLRFYSSTYESRKYYVYFNPLVTDTTESTTAIIGQTSSGQQAPLGVFAIAACVLAFPAFCALIFCLIWAKKRCKSPCSVYKECVSKRKLRRTADWVTLVQTRWFQKPNPTSAGGVSNMDYQYSQPTSSLATPEGTRSDRSVHWREINDYDEEMAPSLKRPLMAINEKSACVSACIPMDNISQTMDESLSSISIATDTWYSDVYGRNETNDNEPRKSLKSLKSLSMDADKMEDGEKDQADFADAEDNVPELRDLIRKGDQKRVKLDDEVSFVTALDVDPKCLDDGGGGAQSDSLVQIV